MNFVIFCAEKNNFQIFLFKYNIEEHLLIVTQMTGANLSMNKKKIQIFIIIILQLSFFSNIKPDHSKLLKKRFNFGKTYVLFLELHYSDILYVLVLPYGQI